MPDITSLVRLVRGGDKKAFRELYELLVSDLYGFVYRYVRSAETAQEIVQDAFVNLWTHRESLDESRSVRSYLFASVYHSTIKEFRRQVRNPLMRDYVEYVEGMTCQMANTLDYDTYVRAIRKAMDSLPPREKEILTLSKIMGLSSQEIAARLGITDQVVRNQVSAAMKIIRESISRLD